MKETVKLIGNTPLYHIEDTNISLPTQRNITATFFENRTEKFNTMDALYRHCVAILK